MLWRVLMGGFKTVSPLSCIAGQIHIPVVDGVSTGTGAASHPPPLLDLSPCQTSLLLSLWSHHRHPLLWLVSTCHYYIIITLLSVCVRGWHLIIHNCSHSIWANIFWLAEDHITALKELSHFNLTSVYLNTSLIQRELTVNITLRDISFSTQASVSSGGRCGSWLYHPSCGTTTDCPQVRVSTLCWLKTQLALSKTWPSFRDQGPSEIYTPVVKYYVAIFWFG